MVFFPFHIFSPSTFVICIKITQKPIKHTALSYLIQLNRHQRSKITKNRKNWKRNVKYFLKLKHHKISEKIYVQMKSKQVETKTESERERERKSVKNIVWSLMIISRKLNQLFFPFFSEMNIFLWKIWM